MTNRNLFPHHLDWTETTCFYAAATHGFRQALLAGPYPTAAAAEAALPAARQWALSDSGDPDAGIYTYRVLRMDTGHGRSILGEHVLQHALHGNDHD